MNSPFGRLRDEVQADWRKRAACTRHDPDMWFATDGSPEADRARGVCGTCPVLTDCHEFAKRTRQRNGIWGGRDRTPTPRPDGACRRGHLLTPETSSRRTDISGVTRRVCLTCERERGRRHREKESA